MWSRAPAASYLDHPPMVAWFIRLGTAIAGDGPLGVRLLAPLAAAVGSVVLARAADRLFPAARPGIAAAALLNATLAFGIGAVTMTPDTPLLLFITAAFAGLVGMAGRAAMTPAKIVGGPGWVWLGVGAGLAMLSKYTAVLLAPSVLVWLLVARPLRAWLVSWRLWAAAALALALFAPVLAWNAGHGWASFAKQGARADAFQPGRALQFVAELIGGQIGLATPVIAVLFGAGIVVAVCRLRDPAWSLLAALTVVPALVFFEHALGDRVQANWPAIMFPAAAIAAAMLDGTWVRLRSPGIVLGLVITASVWVQGMAAPVALPFRLDPTLMRLAGWTELADALAARAAADGAAFVASDNYGHAAVLARLLPPSLPVLGVEPRWALFDLPSGAPVIAGRAGLLLRSERRADPPDGADWRAIEPIGELIRGRDGVAAERYRVYRVVGGDTAPEPIVVMPRPR